MLRTTFLAWAALTPLLNAQDSQEDFFGLDKIWDIHIELEREDWVQMYPQGDSTATRLFGRFPYRIGNVTIGTQRLEDVGIRMKGNATFMANGGTLKKSLKLDFNREDSEQKFLGMGKLNLQCNALDATQIKEAVSYQIYRDCGVVAGRTCFARVFLTLRGELEEAYVGLYTVVEQVDQRFAKRTLGSGGLILKPQGETLAYLGEQWNEDYDNSYFPKSKVSEELAQPIIETAALFDEPSDEAFVAGIEEVMDVERFLKYTAVTTLLINTDSPLTVPDNYYLVVPQDTKKVTIVPWDMNWSMGAYGYITQTPTVELSVMRPTRKEVFRRVLGQAQFKERYRELVAEYIAGPCSAEALTAAIHRAHATVEDALAEEEMRIEAIMSAEPELGGQPSRMPVLQSREGDDLLGLLEFVEAREKSVLDQLAGKSEGVTAPNLWGPNDRTPRGSSLRDLLREGAAPAESASTLDRQGVESVITASFAAVDADHSESLDENEMTAVLRRQWQSAPRRSRREQDPSADRARRALNQIDADADSMVSAEEWQAGIEALLRFWDRDMDRRWSRRELGLGEGR